MTVNLAINYLEMWVSLSLSLPPSGSVECKSSISGTNFLEQVLDKAGSDDHMHALHIENTFKWA